MAPAADPEPEDQDRQRWSAAHGGIDPDSSVWVGGWLSLVHRLARPLAARHVRPGLITLAGLVVSALVPLVASAPGAWPLAAAVLAVAAGVLDGIDGAVARMDGTDTPWGAVLDEVADRVSDLLLISALWTLGAPVWACVVVAGLTLLLEALRSSARGVGMVGPGTITAWERPSRVIVVTTVAALCGLVAPLALPEDVPEVLAGTGAVVAAVLAGWSLGHLGLAVHRQLWVRRDPRDR